MALTRAELLANIAAGTGETRLTVGAVLDALAVEVAEQLKSGEPVTLPGIGKLAPISSVLDALALEVAAQLQAGEEITIPGIGKLAPVAKPARVGRNPATGAEVQIAAKTTVKFTAAKALKDAIA